MNEAIDHPAIPVIEKFVGIVCKHNPAVLVNSGLDTTAIIARTNYADAGRVIGALGNTLHNLKKMVSVIGHAHGRPSEFELDAPRTGLKDPPCPPGKVFDYDFAPVMDFVSCACDAAIPDGYQMNRVDAGERSIFEICPYRNLDPAFIPALSIIVARIGAATGRPNMSARRVGNHNEKAKSI